MCKGPCCRDVGLIEGMAVASQRKTARMGGSGQSGGRVAEVIWGTTTREFNLDAKSDTEMTVAPTENNQSGKWVEIVSSVPQCLQVSVITSCFDLPQ
jgi:hypothetical protein